MGANQAPPSLGFSRQEYWSGLPLPSLLQWRMVKFWKHHRLLPSLLVYMKNSEYRYVFPENISEKVLLNTSKNCICRVTVMQIKVQKEIIIMVGRKRCQETLCEVYTWECFVLWSMAVENWDSSFPFTKGWHRNWLIFHKTNTTKLTE